MLLMRERPPPPPAHLLFKLSVILHQLKLSLHCKSFIYLQVQSSRIVPKSRSAPTNRGVCELVGKSSPVVAIMIRITKEPGGALYFTSWTIAQFRSKEMSTLLRGVQTLWRLPRSPICGKKYPSNWCSGVQNKECNRTTFCENISKRAILSIFEKQLVIWTFKWNTLIFGSKWQK